MKLRIGTETYGTEKLEDLLKKAIQPHIENFTLIKKTDTTTHSEQS